jgi:long-chain acyl-CoA synthetase
MLRLPANIRQKYDLSSHKVAVHAAAPCPVDVKHQMIDWWGPIIREYYAGSEGNGYVAINSHDWLQYPGSVGKALIGTLRICDEDGDEVPIGTPGTVYFDGGPAFAYHNDPEKTAQSRHPKGWSTLGDVGYVNDAGYLFLTDRRAFTIISGGVNIYPQECENLLISHPKVIDAAVIGVPNTDFGEEVKAVVQPLDMARANDALQAELMTYCRQHLSHVKCPKTIDFVEKLPRRENGKLYKQKLRDSYWVGHNSRII